MGLLPLKICLIAGFFTYVIFVFICKVRNDKWIQYADDAGPLLNNLKPEVQICPPACENRGAVGLHRVDP